MENSYLENNNNSENNGKSNNNGNNSNNSNNIAGNVKIVDCEVCMEKFPIDCFEFFPCAHKVCFFCYNKLKDLQCPYCRINMNVEVKIRNSGNLETINEDVYEEFESDYENDNFDLPEIPNNRRNNLRQSRNSSERFSR